MTKDLVIIVLGIFVAVLPFLGFPSSWDRIILVVTGFSISLLMYVLRRDFFSYVERLRRRRDAKPHHTDSYVESEGGQVEAEPAVVAPRRRARPSPVPEQPHVEETPQQAA